MRPLEATYLAWLDLAPTATTTRRRSPSSGAGCRLAPVDDYPPGLTGHVRLNLATSPERLTEIVERLAKAWT